MIEMIEKKMDRRFVFLGYGENSDIVNTNSVSGR